MVHSHSSGGQRDISGRNVGDPTVSFERVSLTPREGLLRRRRPLFHDLSFSVGAGEAVGVLLPPGAGKTELVKLATGHRVPSGGSVTVLDVPPDAEPERLIGRVGAIVNERTGLWRDVPLEDTFRMLARHYRMPTAESERHRAELLERLQLDRAARTPMEELTLAQRRRAELIGALLPDPEVLILDEPTRDLDAASRERLRSVLRQENRVHRRTLLLVTSDLAEIESVCRRLLVVVDGRIGFDGAVAALNERLGTERVLVVDLLEPAAPLDDLPGTELISVEAGGLRQRLGIAPGRTATAAVLSEVLSRTSVRNLTLQEPDVDDLVRRLSR